MRLTSAICAGSAFAGSLHHAHIKGAHHGGAKSRIHSQLTHLHHGAQHAGAHHLKHFHGLDVKVIPEPQNTDTVVVDDGLSTDTEHFEVTDAAEILLTDIATIPEEIGVILGDDNGTLEVELDATEDIDELPAKIAAALHEKAGDLINESEVRDAIENVQKQLKDVGDLLRRRAATAAAKAQEISVKAQGAAADALAVAKNAVGTGAATLKEKAAKAQDVASDVSKKAQDAAASALAKAKDVPAGSAVDNLKQKLADGAEQSKKAANSVAKDVKDKAKAAAKAAADTLNEFAKNESGESSRRILKEAQPSPTTLAVGSAGVGVAAIAGVAYAVSKHRSPSSPAISPSIEAQQVDTLRDIAEGTFDMY